MSSGICDNGFSQNPLVTTQESWEYKPALHRHRRHLPRHTVEKVILDKDQPVPEVSQEPAFGNRCFQPTKSLFNQQCLASRKFHHYTQIRSYGIQAISSFKARQLAGVAQPLVGCSRTEVLDDNCSLDQVGVALKFESQLLGKSAAQKCLNSLPIRMEIHNFAHHSLPSPSQNYNTAHELCGSSPLPQGQDLEYGDTSLCPSLISDTEDDFDYSDSETNEEHISNTSENGEAYLAKARSLAARMLLRSKGNVIELKNDKGQSYIQNAGSTSDGAQDSRDDHSSCSSRNNRVRKRNLHHGSRDEESVDGSGDESRKRPRRTPSAMGDKIPGAVSLLACPFYKFDHRRYSEVNLAEKEYRGCSSVYITDISRLKQHLYRVHGRPEHYCGSCYKVFDFRSQLDSHIRRRPPCENAKPIFTEKITDKQLIQLKKKQYGKTIAQNWYTIFEILFPQAELPESPFLEDARQVGIRTYLSFYQDAITPRLVQELGLDEGLQQTVNSILDQTASQVLQQLAQERVPSPTESSDQQPLRQNSSISYQANQPYDYDHLYPDNHSGNSFNTPELTLASTWNGGAHDASNSRQISPADFTLSPEYPSANSSLVYLPHQYLHSAFVESAEQVMGMSLNFAENTLPYFDSEFVLEDDPQPSRTYSD